MGTLEGHESTLGEREPDGRVAGRILILDDDPELRATLARGLGEAGYECEAVESAAAARAAISRASDMALILVDVMMPDEDGWQFVQRLRSFGDDTPVIYLTARDAVSERVRGLRLGADDYLIKPFDFSELLARIDAVLRRRRAGRQLRVGKLEIDTERRHVDLEGRRLELSPREYELLDALARARGRVMTRAELLEDVWGIDFETGTNTVDVHVARLRKRLGKDHARLLQTVVGEGYRLSEPNR